MQEWPAVLFTLSVAEQAPYCVSLMSFIGNREESPEIYI